MSLTIAQHPDRVLLSNELHARPHPPITAPTRVAALALERVGSDTGAELSHLIALLDHYGLPHPAPHARHMTVDLGRARLAWELHTEFVTYTLIEDGMLPDPFSARLFDLLPEAWQQSAPGRLLSSCLVRIEHAPDLDTAADRIAAVSGDWFQPQSLAVSRVVDDAAVVASDFRLDPAGHIRFATIVLGKTGPQRIGRIVGRILEIETYKSLALLTLPIARQMFAELGGKEQDLERIVSRLAAGESTARDALDGLLNLSAEIERDMAQTAFRFTAAEAYGRLVHQRIDVLREVRCRGYQTFAEIMQRQFNPALRTCSSAWDRLQVLSQRLAQAADLLATRVSVQAGVQNREVLEKMDRRAELQLRLQETVEGLSVVAISYYGVNLAASLLAPLAGSVGIGKPSLTAALVPVVVLTVWLAVRRIRQRVSQAGRAED